LGSNLATKKRLAAEVLGCGVSRVWIDPERTSLVEEALTREDIRKLVKRGIIRKKPKKSGTAHAKKPKKRKRGPGSRKGSPYARLPKKRRWIQRIRPLRRELRRMRDRGIITRRVYRWLYRRLSMFRNVNHLKLFIEKEGLARKPDIIEEVLKEIS